jgi:hypothetical protein
MAAMGARQAALELLARLKHLPAAGALIDLLPRLPRELWPAAGRTLEQITGQRFGPQAGDGAAEVSVAAKKWRAWLQQSGAK